MRTAARRSPAIAGLVAVLLVIGLVAPAAARDIRPTAEASFAELINVERAAVGLPALGVHSDLVRVSRDWTGVMADEDRMYHNPNLATDVTAQWSSLGENVGWTLRTGADEATLVDRLHTAWMESEGHRRNVLGNWTHVGVGVEVASNGKMWGTVVFMRSAEPVRLPPPPTTLPTPSATRESIGVSGATFSDAGSSGHTASFAVIGRAEVFADALGAAGLAAGAAPVLFTPGPTPTVPNPSLDPAVRTELQRILAPGATVYLLGGLQAVSTRAERDLTDLGYRPRRLAGPSRVETSVAVAREIVARHGRADEVLIARADAWPDAVTGGAYAASTASPVLLTGRDDLHPAVAAFLAEQQPRARFALGGTAALSDRTVTAARAERISGVDRTATAVAVAERLWGRTIGTAGDQYVTVPAGGDNGWAYALAHAPYSAVHDAPQLLVHGDGVPDGVTLYLTELGYSRDVRGSQKASSGVTPVAAEQFSRLIGE